MSTFIAECKRAGDNANLLGSDASVFHDLIDRYMAMPGNGTGGSLRVVLWGGVLERSVVWWCYHHALKREDAAGAALAGALLCLPDNLYWAALTERRGD